jgi:hypothetical protein
MEQLLLQLLQVMAAHLQVVDLEPRLQKRKAWSLQVAWKRFVVVVQELTPCSLLWIPLCR